CFECLGKTTSSRILGRIKQHFKRGLPGPGGRKIHRSTMCTDRPEPGTPSAVWNTEEKIFSRVSSHLSGE
ncbi:hypothetical protein LDENG_00250970, partial [Lucifuga dentata]